MTRPARHARRGLACAALVATLGHASAATDALEHSLDISLGNQAAERATQTRIDRISDGTRDMLESYLALERELETLNSYNAQLERLLAAQERETRSIRQQMQDVERTRQEILPLMLRMIARLREISAPGIPFLSEERGRRVEQLVALMDRADITIAEKYRHILDAYRIELEYGRTLEAYRGELEVEGALRTVDFLRFGRIGLYYLTLDREHAGYWDTRQATWSALDSRQAAEIRRGLRIARKQAAPDLVRVPVAAPTVVGQ